MPFKINHIDGISTVQLSGRITGRDILQAARAVIDLTEFEPGRPWIWDARDVKELVLHFDEFKALRAVSEERIRQRGTAGRTAIVAVRELDQEAAHFIRACLKRRPIQVFDRMDEARAWLLDR